mmetsp:Transcript_30459/g.64300  ORF Transcript_30459/g.64300 Transcript_30459/m.64300 type:complete len:181 (-) Transcript_30459:1101-1643(-)
MQDDGSCELPKANWSILMRPLAIAMAPAAITSDVAANNKCRLLRPRYWTPIVWSSTANDDEISSCDWYRTPITQAMVVPAKDDGRNEAVQRGHPVVEFASGITAGHLITRRIRQWLSLPTKVDEGALATPIGASAVHDCDSPCSCLNGLLPNGITRNALGTKQSFASSLFLLAPNWSKGK